MLNKAMHKTRLTHNMKAKHTSNATTKSLNQRSCISIITVECQGIVVQITINGWPLNKAIVCSRLETKISFHHLLLLLEIFSRPSCSFRTWKISILLPHLQIKGSRKGKVLPKCGRKKAQSDLVTCSLSPLLVIHFLFVLLSCFESI